MSAPNTSKELLPCPFCGSEARISGGGPRGVYYVACSNDQCFASLGECYDGDAPDHFFENEEAAARAWSKRHTHEPSVLSLCARTVLDEFLAKYWPDLELRERSAHEPPQPSNELSVAIAFARLELLELENGRRELTQCPGIENVAKEIAKARASVEPSPPSKEMSAAAQRRGTETT